MKISEFTEILKAGKDSIIPIVVGKINRKITVDNLKESMELSGDDISYTSQNNLDGGNSVQDAIASIATAVNQLARDGIAIADIKQAVKDYFTENPIATYSYTLDKDDSSGVYTLKNITGDDCGTITPATSISANSVDVPTSKAVNTFVTSKTKMANGGRVVVSNSSGNIISSSIETATLNRVVTDSGWKDANSVGYRFDLFNSELNVQYRKVGQTVYIRGVVTPNRVLKASDMTDTMIIFNLTSGYMPSRACQFVCQGAGSRHWLLSVQTTGEVTFSRYSKGDAFDDCPVGAWLPFNVSFLIN